MAADLYAKIRANPKYQEFVSIRNTYSFIMSIFMLVAYFGYILLIAFNKEMLGQKMGEGMVTSIGIPMGVGVIVFTIVITWVYVRRANSDFDERTAEIIKEANK
ncbi:MAG: DUF485 domain-containing protein [Rhodocyclaceae bacterium]|nr:DUF485 domain-containing protein [Rhodocyclaceae bacterium]